MWAWRTTNSVGAWVMATVFALAMALTLQAGAPLEAFAEEGPLVAGALDDVVQSEINPADVTTATVTTDAAGEAYLKITIGEGGVYSIGSTASQGVSCDTIGYLYDESMEELEVSDDCHADTNFCISTELAAGSYYLKVTGKELQPKASITVAIQSGLALSTLDCVCKYDGNAVSGFELGVWEHGEKTEWVAADSTSFKVKGHVDRSVFSHAQENDAVSKLAWKAGFPKEAGRYTVMVEAKGNAYVGVAYYYLDGRASAKSIEELDPVVSTTVCKAVSSVELGKYTTVPTNWSTRWDAITAGYYDVVGYCARNRFETLGGDEASITWTKGLPRDAGDFVVKCQATDTDENPYTGSCYVWTSVGKTGHVGSGKWIVDKQPTYSASGQRHMTCAYCGAACDFTTIPQLKDTLETAGSGETMADYKVLSADTVRYEVCLASGASATVPDTVVIGGGAYRVVAVADGVFASKSQLKSVKIGKNVTSIGKNVFKGCKNITSITIGAGVKTIGDAAFSGCSSLKSLTLGKSVISIGKSAFNGCKSMASIKGGEGVKTIGDSAFSGCSSLKSLTLGKNVTRIGKSAFNGCKKLKTLKLKTAKLKKAGVKSCLKGSSVKTVKVPKSKKKAYAKLFVKKVCGKKVKVK